MMSQEDEVESDRHMNMSFTEFIEAFCRVAEQCSFEGPFDNRIRCLIDHLCKVHMPHKVVQLRKDVDKYTAEGVYANDIDTGLIKF